MSLQYLIIGTPPKILYDEKMLKHTKFNKSKLQEIKVLKVQLVTDYGKPDL